MKLTTVLCVLDWVLLLSKLASIFGAWPLLSNTPPSTILQDTACACSGVSGSTHVPTSPLPEAGTGPWTEESPRVSVKHWHFTNQYSIWWNSTPVWNLQTCRLIQEFTWVLGQTISKTVLCYFCYHNYNTQVQSGHGIQAHNAAPLEVHMISLRVHLCGYNPTKIPGSLSWLSVNSHCHLPPTRHSQNRTHSGKHRWSGPWILQRFQRSPVISPKVVLLVDCSQGHCTLQPNRDCGLQTYKRRTRGDHHLPISHKCCLFGWVHAQLLACACTGVSCDSQTCATRHASVVTYKTRSILCDKSWGICWHLSIMDTVELINGLLYRGFHHSEVVMYQERIIIRQLIINFLT